MGLCSVLGKSNNKHVINRLKRLKEMGLIHVSGWKAPKGVGRVAKVFAVGDKPDAEKPEPRTAWGKRYRELMSNPRQEAPSGFALANVWR